MTLREELDALAKEVMDLPTERRFEAAAARAYRTGQLVPLPEVEELARVIGEQERVRCGGYPLEEGAPELNPFLTDEHRQTAAAIINHMKGKTDG